MLANKKTYILAGILAVAFFLRKIGVLPPEVDAWLQGLAPSAGLVTLRQAISKKYKSLI